MDKIKEELGLLEKARLIKPFILTKDSRDIHGLPAELQRRYRIPDNLRGLMRPVWDLYKEKFSILETKYLVGILNDDDRTWLKYLLGKENTQKLTQEWEDRLPKKSISEEAIERKEDQFISAKRGYIRMREIEFKVKVDELFEKYLSVLNEYHLPESFIRTILSIH